MDFSLLKTLCEIPGISGDETAILDFIQNYVHQNAQNWKSQPQLIRNRFTHDAIILIFGKPTTAVFAHVDTVGYTAGYASDLIKVGSPTALKKDELVGKDKSGDVVCSLHKNDQGNQYLFNRAIERGTPLSYKVNYQEEDSFIQSAYIDNRLGVWVALQLCATLENGAIAFSTYEEVGGGNAQVLGKILFEDYQITQALIADITWVTSGVQHHQGVAISTRDSGIPRRDYVKKIIRIAEQENIAYQLEVESAGGSDGNVLNDSPYPYDWCFIGAPEDNVHSPREKVSKFDALEMLKLFQVLMKHL